MKQARENGKDLPVMMYLHGFMSGANGAKQRQLQKHFKGRWRVIAPELDADPEKSLTVIDELIERERPEIIVGTSLGAWMAMMCRHGVAPLVFVNPVTAPQEELARWLDEPQQYFCKRLDGVQTYTLTPEVLDKYGAYSTEEAIAFEGDSFHVLCSTNDDLLGDRHIRTLQPWLSPDQIMIVDDFGHQCRDAGLTHLFEILEKLAAQREHPYIPGEFAMHTKEQHDARFRRLELQEQLKERGLTSKRQEWMDKIWKAIGDVNKD